jgi:O-antigen/teichoic acid export membrane protein
MTGSADVPARHSFLSSAVLTWVTQLAVGMLSLGNVLVVARALGANGRGQVAFLTTVAYLTSQLSLLGVDQANINFACADRRARSALATNSVILSLLFGAGSIVVVTGLIALFPRIGGPTPTALRWLMLASVPMLILQVYLLLLVRADYAFGVANVAYLLGPLVNVTVNGVFAATGHLTVGTAAGTWIAGQGLGALVLAWHVACRSAGFGHPDARLALRSVRFGVKAQAGRFMSLGNYRLDQWILGALAGARALGRYSVAVAWAETLFYLPTALVAVQRPDLVRSEPRSAARQATLGFRATVMVTIPLVLLLIVVAPFLCVTLFGAAFRGSIAQLRILSAGALGIVALKVFGNALTAQSKPMLETAAVAVAFVATVALDIALIPSHGGIGASLASAIAYSAGGVVAAVLLSLALGASAKELIPRRRDAASLWERITAAVSALRTR